jgi:hypothetical protein
MGLRPTQGDEKRASVQQPLPMNRRPLLVIPSEAEGSAVPRTFRGDVFRPERSVVERSAISFFRFAQTLFSPHESESRVARLNPCHTLISATRKLLTQPRNN